MTQPRESGDAVATLRAALRGLLAAVEQDDSHVLALWVETAHAVLAENDHPEKDRTEENRG